MRPFGVELLRILFVLVAPWLLVSCADRLDEPLSWPPSLSVTVLDVGQGDATLVSFSEQTHWLIDGGGSMGGQAEVGRRKLLPALRRQGVQRLEKVFVSHGHADHYEGLFAVLDALPVEELWVPDRRTFDGRAQALLSLSQTSGTRLREVARGHQLQSPSGAFRVELLHPLRDWKSHLSGSDSLVNDSSIVMRIALGDLSFLFTGDIEAAAEALLVNSGRLGSSTVIKVPHHASRTSSTAAFLNRVDPLLAVAGIGKGNRFGFPHASVSARYLARGTSLYWTARHGAMRMTTEGFSLTLERLPRQGRSVIERRWSSADLARWRERRSKGPLAAKPLAQVEADLLSGRLRGRGLCPVEPPSVNGYPLASTTRVVENVKVRAHTAVRKQETVLLMEERHWQRNRGRRGRLSAPWR
ncbi:MAG: hypothetical protein CMP23_12100 [Rickettsiales bacterium]|nr:hypothetical protein [Rickettsiales bacterium]